MRNVIIAPSLLAANFAYLDKEIKQVSDAGASWLHFDVMDGHFVNNISFGIPVLKSISKIHNMVNDVHLMIENPSKYAVEFIKSGADILTFHYEAMNSEEDINKLIDLIHQNNAKAGISIKPGTDYNEIIPYLNKLDLVLIMSVDPGFGGQEFMPSSLNKISFLRKYIDNNNLKTLIEVDGGIDNITAKMVKEAGVDVLVSGSYIFNSEDKKERIESLK